MASNKGIAAQWIAQSMDAAKPMRSACCNREMGLDMSSSGGWRIELK